MLARTSVKVELKFSSSQRSFPRIQLIRFAVVGPVTVAVEGVAVMVPVGGDVGPSDGPVNVKLF